MKTVLRGIAFLVVVGVAGLAGAWVWAVSTPEIAAIAPPDPASFDADEVERGAMLAALGDCAVCHTAPGGETNAGGFAFPTPFGTIHSTNITPDVDTGIGAWSLDAFVRAMRDGVDRRGNHLYPAFPYDHFARVTDEDLAAIYAHLMSEPAVAAPPVPNDMRFPFGYRPILAGWKLLFHDAEVWQPDPALSDDQNRGQYLVEGLGHCGACHTPRNAFGALRADAPFAGGEAEGWHVPAIGAASTSPVAWSEDAWLNYLFDGWDEHHGIAAGPMKPVVDHLFDADEDDVYAIGVYMASLSGEPDPAAIDAAYAAIAALDWAEDENPGGANAPTDPALLAGEVIFDQQCSKCHKTRVSDQQPASLGVTPTVNAIDPRGFIRIVRDGIVPPYGSRDRSMPGQEVNITAEDMANLAAFVRWRFTDLPPWPDLRETVDAVFAEAPHGG